jgi:hypothetical protein
MRGVAVTRLCTTLVVIAIALSSAGAANAKPKAPAPITVRGGFVNLPPTYCNPATITPGPGTPPGSFTGMCAGAGPFDGGWTGIAYDTYRITVDTAGNASGVSDSWLYARYMGDGTYGGLHFKGTFSIDAATGSFQESARIVGGTCAFAGSSGSISFTGQESHGGYVASWSRPSGAAVDGCNPFDPTPALP